MTSPKVVYKLETVQKLQKLLTICTQHSSILRHNLQSRLEYVDRCVQRTADRTSETLKARLNQRMGKSKISNDEVPVCYAQLETITSWLCGAFLTGTPIIAATTKSVDKLDGVTMLNALAEQDEVEFKWFPQLLTALNDSLKSPFVAVEVQWEVRSRNTLRNSAGKTVVDSLEYGGNSIKRLDPYNVIFDPSVKIHEVNEKGAFIGYVEQFSAIQSRVELDKLDPLYLIRKFANVTSPATSSKLYYIPEISYFNTANSHSNFNWAEWFQVASKKSGAAVVTGLQEHVTLYVKLYAQDFGLTSVENTKPVIMHLVYVNGWLRYAKPLENAHGEFPIVLATADIEGIGFQSSSLIEHLTTNQANLSAMVNGQLHATRRAVADRALYDPNRIDPRHIDSANPAAKIAVKSSALNKDLSSAYAPIPYNDTVSPYFQQNFSILSSFAQQTTGVNQASQGNFVKGNKTRSEFQTVMTKSDARLQKIALCLESTLFAPLKTRLKYNYLQFAENAQVEVRSSSQRVEVNIQTIRDQAIEFGMSDGMQAISKMLDFDLIETALTMIPQLPELNMEYSAASMFVYVLKNGGLNLEQFKRSPEEQAQMRAFAQQAQAQPQSGVSNGK